MGTREDIIEFVDFHKRRVQRKELNADTLTNFFLAVKLFYIINGITRASWKGLSRALPWVKRIFFH